MPDPGSLTLMYTQYYKGLLLVEARRHEEAYSTAESLFTNAVACSDYIMLWCARLLMTEIMILSDRTLDAERELHDLGEENAFMPFLRTRFLSLSSEVRRRQGRAEEAARLAAESVAAGRVGPRYNYGEEPLLLRHALALHALGDLDGARNVIREARDELLERAAKIPEPAVRRSYLEGLGAHARTLALAEEWLGEHAPVA